MSTDLYVYKVRDVIDVVDGDTYDLILDVGFHQRMASRFRLNGWDTPELRRGSDYEKECAQEATQTVERWLDGYVAAEQQILARTHKSDSFGRWLVDLFVGADDLGEWLGGNGLATRWPTRWREEYDHE